MLLYTLDSGEAFSFRPKHAHSARYNICALLNFCRCYMYCGLAVLPDYLLWQIYAYLLGMTPATGSRLFGSVGSSGESFPHGFEFH